MNLRGCGTRGDHTRGSSFWGSLMWIGNCRLLYVFLGALIFGNYHHPKLCLTFRTSVIRVLPLYSPHYKGLTNTNPPYSVGSGRSLLTKTSCGATALIRLLALRAWARKTSTASTLHPERILSTYMGDTNPNHATNSW